MTFWVRCCKLRAMPGKETSIFAEMPAGTLSILCFRSIQPEDKSFAVGIQFMLLRVLGKLKRVEMPSWKITATWGFVGISSLSSPRATEVLFIQRFRLTKACPKPGKDAALQGRGGLHVVGRGTRHLCGSTSMRLNERGEEIHLGPGGQPLAVCRYCHVRLQRIRVAVNYVL